MFDFWSMPLLSSDEGGGGGDPPTSEPQQDPSTGGDSPDPGPESQDPPAGAKKTDGNPDSIPVSRFNQVNERMKNAESDLEKAQKRLKEFEDAEEERKRKKLEEDGQFKELADSEKQKREQLEADYQEKLAAKDSLIREERLERYLLGVAATGENPIARQEYLSLLTNREGLLDDEGNPIAEKCREAVEGLRETSPELFQTKAPPKSVASDQPSGKSKPDADWKQVCEMYQQNPDDPFWEDKYVRMRSERLAAGKSVN